MDRRILIGLSIVLTLPSAARLHAESTPAAQGYYYYPQPSYYTPYAPYGYQAPGYPSAPAAQAPVPAKVETPKPGNPPAAPTAAPDGLDQGRYPRVLDSELKGVADRFRVEQGRLGAVLADREGRTLYAAPEAVTDPSVPGDARAHGWRPCLADEGAAPSAPFGVMQRPDGTRQWTHAGKALYRWIGDERAGDVTGDGIDGAWHAVRVRRGG